MHLTVLMYADIHTYRHTDIETGLITVSIYTAWVTTKHCKHFPLLIIAFIYSFI